MGIYSDVQKLEPGDRVILFELDCTSIGGDLLLFHPYSQLAPIVFQGKSYTPWAVEATGLGRTGDVQQVQPTLSVGNIGMDTEGSPVPGFVSSLCIALDDMVGAQIIIHETFAKYLDGAEAADPEQELPQEVWYIQQKTQDDPDVVAFELSDSMTLDGVQLPRRPIQASTCPWLWIGGYRGPYCQYTGNAYFTDQDVPSADPGQDKCGGRVSSCQLRFGAQQVVQPVEAVVNFGGFPAADRLR